MLNYVHQCMDIHYTSLTQYTNQLNSLQKEWGRSHGFKSTEKSVTGSNNR